MNRRILLACILLSFTATARAATLSEGHLSVVIPDTVVEGQPFLAEVTLEKKVDHVFVEWMDKKIEVALVEKEGAYTGEALLGAGLGIKLGQYRIVVESDHPDRKDLVLGKITVTPAIPQQRPQITLGGMMPLLDGKPVALQDQERNVEAVASERERGMWNFPFLRPVQGEVTSDFGLQRFLNGEPRRLHYGVDFRGPFREEVRAANTGRVILTGSFFYNGLSVFLDHGQGIVTMYFHLSRILVANGQQVERGHVIGLVGSTGRSTGPHLHFAMKILGQCVDPLPLVTAGSPFDRSRGGL